MAEGEDEEPVKRTRRKRGLLKLYYGTSEDSASSSPASNPLDIDGSGFDADAYVKRLRETNDLQRLIGREEDLARQIKSLDSDMQTLVYENYNKFISATDTIRKMKTQVDGMEEEMEHLSASMATIAGLSSELTTSLEPNREKIRQLSGSHAILKKLQFLFELPARLKQCVEMQSYEQAVRYYAKASRVLHHYRNLDSFRGIYDECETIVEQLRQMLVARVARPDVSQRELVSSIELLAKISQNPMELCDMLLDRAQEQWRTDRAAQEAEFEQAMRDYKQQQAEQEQQQAAEAEDASEQPTDGKPKGEAEQEQEEDKVGGEAVADAGADTDAAQSGDESAAEKGSQEQNEEEEEEEEFVAEGAFDDGDKATQAADGSNTPACVGGMVKGTQGGDPLNAVQRIFQEQDLRGAKQLLSSGTLDIDTILPYGNITLLHKAVVIGWEEMVLLLLRRNADPNVVADLNVSPLHLAASEGKLAIVRHLLAAGADPQAVTEWGMTAVKYANDHPDCQSYIQRFVDKKT
eukprot:m.488953 g.488953  ORF g.488953 m.488953 type:complete len:521 (+) comp26269_c0_seq1:96-1658(+)